MRYRHMIGNFLYEVVGNEATGQTTFLATLATRSGFKFFGQGKYRQAAAPGTRPRTGQRRWACLRDCRQAGRSTKALHPRRNGEGRARKEALHLARELLRGTKYRACSYL